MCRPWGRFEEGSKDMRFDSLHGLSALCAHVHERIAEIVDSAALQWSDPWVRVGDQHGY